MRKTKNVGRTISSHGYALVRVGKAHPLAVGRHGYAYEHLVVWVAAGNPRPPSNRVIHHKNDDRIDNRIENLELTTRGAHTREHKTGGRKVPSSSPLRKYKLVEKLRPGAAPDRYTEALKELGYERYETKRRTAIRKIRKEG